MKKNIYAIIFSIAAFFTINAQSIQLLDTAGGNLNTAQASYTFTVGEYNSYGIIFYVKNATSSPINIQGKSYIISNPGGIDGLQYCIGTQCHNTGQPVTINTSIPANGTLTSNGLLLDFTDYSGVGYDPTVSYTLFKAGGAASDSVNITVTYHVASITGIKQNSDNVNNVSVYPNPTTNNISVAYDLKNNTQQATLKIYNTLGTLVKTTTLENYTTNKKIDVSSLDEGVYFYSISVDGKTVKTSRLVVSR